MYISNTPFRLGVTEPPAAILVQKPEGELPVDTKKPGKRSRHPGFIMSLYFFYLKLCLFRGHGLSLYQLNDFHDRDD